MRIHATHVGTATLLLELPGFTILTDPVLDGPGRVHFGWGMRSRRERGPHLPAEALPPVDLVLLSHHHHADNLDTAGRAVLGRAGLVVTTRAGAARRGSAGGRWASRPSSTATSRDRSACASPPRRRATGLPSAGRWSAR